MGEASRSVDGEPGRFSRIWLLQGQEQSTLSPLKSLDDGLQFTLQLVQRPLRRRLRTGYGDPSRYTGPVDSRNAGFLFHELHQVFHQAVFPPIAMPVGLFQADAEAAGRGVG